MYIAITYCILLIAVMFAWYGKRDGALLTFSISLIMAAGTFYHHVSEVIGLSL